MAISAGKTARKPKKATPPAMMGMLSALFSAHARFTICFHPRSGISVGFSAWMPGSSCSLGAPGGGCCGSAEPFAEPVFAAPPFAAPVFAAPLFAAPLFAAPLFAAPLFAAPLFAAARRAAFSSTRSRIRSTALSRLLVPVIAVSLWMWAAMRPSAVRVRAPGVRSPGARARSVARPGAGHLAEAMGSRAVYGGLRGREDGALDRGGEDDLPHRVLALQCARGVVLLRDELPDLLEDGPRHDAGQDPAQQADRPVDELDSLAPRLLLSALPASSLDVARSRRQITRPATSPPRAIAPPSTSDGSSR